MKSNCLPPRLKTVVIKRGSVSVKIYPGTTHGYESFTLVYHEGGRRIRRAFNSLTEAKVEAEIAATRLDRAEGLAFQLTGIDRQQYLLAVAELQPLGVPLHLAVQEFVAAKSILGEGSLLDAARLHRAHTDPSRPTKSAEALVAECLEAKASDHLSARYLVQLRSDLKRFARAFQKNVADITGAEMDDWLRSLRHDGVPISGRTRNNLRTSLTTLFAFAKQRGYLPKSAPTEAESVTKAKVVEEETRVLTAPELKTLLAASNGYVRAHVAIAAFAMVRTAELGRLHWEHLDLAENLVKVNASLAKVSRRRLVPIPENLRAWLQSLRSSGPVLPNNEVYKEVTKVARSVGIQWSKNLLRNSAISYRLATVQDPALVAYEAGTSARVIFTNYRQLVTPAQAKTWYSVIP